MIEDGRDDASQAERRLAVSYAPAAVRPAIDALLGLDRALGAILRSTREPLVGQMRLVWWREALERLDHAPPPAEPVLAALAAEVTPRGVSGAALASFVDGWEVLLGEIGSGELVTHASARGGALFAAAAAMLGSSLGDRVGEAGEGWALADLAANLSDAQLAAEAKKAAEQRLGAALGQRWPQRLRSLGALALLASMDVEDRRPAGHPARVGRLIWFRATGL